MAARRKKDTTFAKNLNALMDEKQLTLKEASKLAGVGIDPAPKI